MHQATESTGSAQQDISPSNPNAHLNPYQSVGQGIVIVLLLYGLLVAIRLMEVGFQSAVGTQAERLFTVASHPLLGLMVGTVATALIQSSSTVTSIIVGLVAGGLPVASAVPMVMGANIGTTITNTLVSLGQFGDHGEFRRAFAAATVHDFFNLLSVVIFLPLELAFHPLEHLAHGIANGLVGQGSLPPLPPNLVISATNPLVYLISEAMSGLSAPLDCFITILLGIGLIVGTITLLSQRLQRLMGGRAKTMLHATTGRGAIASLSAGALITAFVQSSSSTTSLMVPLAGAGVLSLEQIYPFMLGANIGTCVTALLAATAISGVEALPSLEIAMVHLLYNVSGVVLVYGLPVLRRWPLVGAKTLAQITSKRRYLAVLYILIVFFALPGLLLGVSAF